MRRQNPPQSYLDKAADIDKYLRPAMLGSMYLVCGILYCAFIGVILTILLYTSVVSPSSMTFGIFAVIGLVPTVFVFLAYFLRPNDPLSNSIANTANSWRRPLSVPPDSCVFKAQLRSGEILSVQLSFYFPSNFQTRTIKERLYTYVHAALANECCSHAVLPTHQELERLIDPPIETLAREFDIPVFYLEIEDVKSYHEIIPGLEEYRSTGTLG